MIYFIKRYCPRICQDCRKSRKISVRIADTQATFEPNTPRTEVQSVTATQILSSTRLTTKLYFMASGSLANVVVKDTEERPPDMAGRREYIE